MLRLGWRRGGLWAPAVGAALSVLVLSPWLAPHPMITSYLFLALTLYFLERPHTLRPNEENGAGTAEPVAFTAYWPLLPLFVLWVNLDSWFLLGPLTVALYLLGQLLQSSYGPGRDDPEAIRCGETATLLGVLAAGLVVCLINPHHVYAFLTPPAQLGLSPATGVLQTDPDFHGLLMSPFEGEYWRPGLGWTAGGLAYYALVLLSGLSFVFNLAGLRWRRFLVWSALLLVSAFQVRAIPFFAVAAGPILALNLQSFFSRRIAWTDGAEAARWAIAGRIASLLAVLVLLGATWAGLLHVPFGEPPRWEIELDPGLRGLAEKIHDWRKEHLLSDDARGFNLSADAANYFAWFCPEEKGVIDARHPLFSAGGGGGLCGDAEATFRRAERCDARRLYGGNPGARGRRRSDELRRRLNAGDAQHYPRPRGQSSSRLR